ncbi:MAG: acyl-phosphate glycerol-3-phosphate acyltransferase [Chloroflexi bacterium]|nr:acyl-phosphate glycerol-3-phosphate acyltransferase [Chloroflexota bacterium]
MLDVGGLPVAIAGLALALGYVIGSLPLSAAVGRAFGVDVAAGGERNPGSANVWALAGPRAGMLALAGDLAKGAVPVALAGALAGWWAGWLAGLGAVVGHAWPALGRLPGGRAVATFGGAAIALSPPAGAIAVALCLVALVLAGRVAAIAVGVGAYPLLFFLVERDPARLAAVLVLYGVTLARYVITWRRRTSTTAG